MSVERSSNITSLKLLAHSLAVGNLLKNDMGLSQLTGGMSVLWFYYAGKLRKVKNPLRLGHLKSDIIEVAQTYSTNKEFDIEIIILCHISNGKVRVESCDCSGYSIVAIGTEDEDVLWDIKSSTSEMKFFFEYYRSEGLR